MTFLITARASSQVRRLRPCGSKSLDGETGRDAYLRERDREGETEREQSTRDGLPCTQTAASVGAGVGTHSDSAADAWVEEDVQGPRTGGPSDRLGLLGPSPMAAS